MERVWGGRSLESLLGKSLPGSLPIGELWEVSDREGAQSIVREGPFRGKTLHELWTGHRKEVFGNLHLSNPSRRFPLLIKLLDARARLSVQVHPPEHRAAPPLTEAKTECWYFLDAEEGAEVFAGLKRGVTEADFRRSLDEGTVEKTLHRLPVRQGESLYLPSGRLHAIGAGLVIVEVQQNSDTTFRVFDWNRAGLDGKPRELHVEESLESIDFADIEPPLTPATQTLIADCPHFRVEKITLIHRWNAAREDDFRVVACVGGGIRCGNASVGPGGFLLIPASKHPLFLEPLLPGTSALVTTLPPVP